MNTSKIIKAYIGAGTYSTTEPITQGDYGYILQIEGTILPSVYRVDFSNDRHNGEALPVYGNEDGAEVPEELIATGKDIFAFYYYIEEGFGKTAYTWKIPNDTRAKAGDREPTPTQQDSIDQLIVRSNEAVTSAEQSASAADQSARSASDDADRAERARDDAQTYANNAQTYANNAQASATSASQSATASANSASASANSASQSAQIKADVEELERDAQAAANSSGISARASGEFASQAHGYAQSASASASSASGYASSAQGSANTASQKATEASGYAQTASEKASEASQSATNASASATQASGYATSAQTAQGFAESARDSAQGYAEDAQGYANDAQASAESISASASQIAQNTADIASLEEDRYKPYVTDTASGSIASFPDGADDLPLKSLVIDINPVQDLHGYDSPWPAGGGKNKLDKDALIRKGYINVNGNIANTSGWASSPYIEVSANTTYTLSNAQKGGSGTHIACYDANQGFISGVLMVANTNTTFTTPNDCKYVRVSVRTFDNEQNTAQLEQGSSATSYAPYENICPISGWTEVDVKQSGFNVWDEEWEGGDINVSNGEPRDNASRIRSKNFIQVRPNTVFYSKSSYPNTIVCYYGKDKEWVTPSGYAVAIDRTFTTPSWCYWIKLYCNTNAYANDISINYPSTDHDYHPYTGRSITIQLGQTVYGAKLYPLEGKALITHKGVDMGTLSWSMQIGSAGQLTRFYTTGIASDVSRVQTEAEYPVMLDLKAPIFVPHSNPVYSRIIDNAMCVLCSTGGFYATCSSYSSAADFETAVSGMMLVYRLATPIEIQLTPTQLNSLYGVNNLWADSGDTTTEYRADTKLFIERLTAPDSADMIADANITSGQYFMVGNSLYKATANIANGSAIIVGTNAVRKSLSEALNELNS